MLPAEAQTLAGKDEGQKDVLEDAFRKIVKDYNFGHIIDRRLFVNESGTVGLLPKVARSEDVVAPLRVSLPFILRPGDSQQYQLVGQVYADGNVYGEAMEDHRANVQSEVVSTLKAWSNVLRM